MTPRISTRRIFRDEMQVHATPAAVFPLLCPVREHEWLETWRCEVLHTESGVAEPGCIFRTETPDGRTMTWVISDHRPAERVEFTCFVPDSRVMRLRIDLEEVAPGTTRLVWTREFTATSREGAAWVAQLNEAEYRATMAGLAERLGHFVGTGTMLRGQLPARA